MNDWAIIIVIYLAVFISSPLLAIFHELGHAFAYLLLTKPNRIDIYIGSYTKAKNSIQFKTGKLHFFIKRSFPFVKGIGLCRSYKAETNYIKDIIILLAGTFFTLFAAGIIVLIAVNSNAGLLLKISCYIILGLAAVSLITNLVPSEIDKTNGKDLDNDGKQILFALQIRGARPAYIEALDYWGKEDYEAAVEKLNDVLAQAPGNEKILRLLVYISLQGKQYNDTALYLSKLENKGELPVTDLFYKGCMQSLTGEHDDAINTYSAVLKRDKNHLLTLNNIAEELIEKGAHEVAKRALDRAIKHNPKFYLPYATLGYSKILQGDLEAGKALASQCLDLNPECADAYKVLGIYYLRLPNKSKATENFNKAIELNADIDVGAYADELKILSEQEITG